MTFGKIYYNLLVNSNKLINKNNKKFLKETIELIKSDKILKEEYKLYSNIGGLAYENDIVTTSKFITECNKFISKNFDEKLIAESNKKLETFLKGKKIKLDESIDYASKKLHESINSFISNSKEDKTTILSETIGLIKESTEKNKTSDILRESRINLPSEYVIPMMVNNFNKKYSETLSESHKKLVSVIIENKDEVKSSYYKELISECLTVINEAIKKNNDTDNDVDIKSDLVNTKEKLLNSSYIKESFVSDSEDIIELIETFKEEVK